MNRSTPRIAPDKPLGGRYKIISQLGVGGFGRTFLAEDLHLPGHPCCVIKHLKPQSKSDDTFQMARRCFNIEAQVLYQLGIHEQIPQLLAHFEENQEFYLAQEFVEGEPLTRELSEGKPWSEGRTVAMLKDILQVLTFVHQQQVIHRDLKPSNLIRRRRDRRIVLIDFGAVKQVSTPTFDPDTGLTDITISIGTQGYMPNEQLAGKPKFCSDIFAVGVLAIQMLSGIHPRHLGEDGQGEIAWHDRVTSISPELRAVIDQMIRYDFRERYVDAAAALVALESLPASVTEEQPDYEALPETIKVASAGVETIVQAGTAPQNAATTSQNATTASQSSTVPNSFGQFAQANLLARSKELGAEEEPASTAIWEPTESLIHSIQATGASFTQAVGRPHFADLSVTPTRSAHWSRRFTHPWVMAGLLATGLVLVSVQTLFPQLGSQILGQNSTKTTAATSSPSRKPSPDSPSQQAAALVDAGNRLLKAKQYNKAIESYDRAITLKTNYAPAYAGRCEALNQLQRPEAAIVSCNDALAFDSDYAEAIWSQGNARLLQKRPYEALKLYEDVTDLKPDFAPGWVKRGVALQKLGRSAEALSVLEQGIKLERNSPEAWITQGEALMTLQRYDAALAALDKALQLQPNDPRILELREQAKARVN